MELHLKREGSTSELGKVAICIFPNRPNPGEVTLDIEIVTKSGDDLLIGTDCKSASYETINFYKQTAAALSSYLGKDQYRKIDDRNHLDVTGEETHIVSSAGIVLSPVAENERGIAFQLMEFHEPRFVQGTKSIDLGQGVKVEGVKTLGGWCRIVRKWPEAAKGEIVERLGISVFADSITCVGLYIWYFAPDKTYHFHSGEVSLQEGTKTEVGHISSIPKVSGFVEFGKWQGWVNELSVTRNFKAIRWSSNDALIVLSARVESPVQRQHHRNRSFLFGIALATALSITVEWLSKLLDSPVVINDYRIFVGIGLISLVILSGLVFYGYSRRIV